MLSASSRQEIHSHRAYGCDILVTTQGEHVLDVEVYVNSAQRAEFLKRFTQKTLSSATESYTGLVQRGLTSYFHEETFVQHRSFYQRARAWFLTGDRLARLPKLQRWLQSGEAQDQRHHAAEREKEEKEIYPVMKTISDCLKPFAHLERQINNAFAVRKDNKKPLDVLKEEITIFEESLERILKEGKQSDHRKDLIKKLKTNIQSFRDHVESLDDKILTAADIQQLFCSQRGAINASTDPCLGSFLTEQLFLLTEYGIEEVFSLTGTRLQFFGAHPAVKALSDAKADIESRALSAKNVSKENSQLPVPAALLDLIDVDSSTEQQAHSDRGEEVANNKKWLSLKPYVDQFQNIEAIDTMVFALSEKSEEKSFKVSSSLTWTVGFKIFVASIGEVFISLVHMVCSIFSFLAEGICWLRNWFPGSPWGMEWFDNGVTQVHNVFSHYLFKFKNESRELYQSTREEQSTRAFLETLYKGKIAEKDNTLNQFFSEYSGHKVAAIVGDFFRSVRKTLGHIWENLKFTLPKAGLLFMSSKNRQQALKAKRQKAFTDKIQQIRDEYQTLHDEIQKQNLQPKSREAGFASSTADNKEEEIKEEEQNHPTWTPGTPWVNNHIRFTGDVLGNIFVGVSDNLIGKMFRQNPAPATAFFMLSMASFTVLMTPSLAANAKTAWLAAPSNWLSHHITGNVVANFPGQQPFSKLVSSFLQWKVTVLSSELGAEIYRGNTEFVYNVFKDLDKITLAAFFMIAVGKEIAFFAHHPIPSLHLYSIVNNHFPWVPEYLKYSLKFVDGSINTFPHVLNTLGEESAVCNTHGIGAWTWIEDALLGAQFCFVLHSMLQSPQRAPVLNVEKVVANLMAVARSSNAHLTEEEVIKLLKENGISQPVGTEALAQYSELISLLANPEETREKIHSSVSQAQQIAQEEVARVAAVERQLTPEQITLRDKRKALEEAMHAVHDMQALANSGFKDKKSAWDFSDYLSDCFDDYIKALEAAQSPIKETKQLKKYYLLNFNNLYCHGTANTIISFFSIFPFLPITLLWRGFKYALSFSPVIKNEVIRNCKKDIMMVFQLFSELMRPVRELLRTVSYVLRLAVMLTTVILISPELVYRCASGQGDKAYDIIKKIEEGVAKWINLHRISVPGWSWLKTKYAKWTSDCNASQEEAYLAHSQEKLAELLEKNRMFEMPSTAVQSANQPSSTTPHNPPAKKPVVSSSPRPNATSSHATMKTAFQNNTAPSYAYVPTPSTQSDINKIVEKALIVQADTSLTEAKKSERFRSIFVDLKSRSEATREEVRERLRLA